MCLRTSCFRLVTCCVSTSTRWSFTWHHSSRVASCTCMPECSICCLLTLFLDGRLCMFVLQKNPTIRTHQGSQLNGLNRNTKLQTETSCGRPLHDIKTAEYDKNCRYGETAETTTKNFQSYWAVSKRNRSSEWCLKETFDTCYFFLISLSVSMIINQSNLT